MPNFAVDHSWMQRRGICSKLDTKTSLKCSLANVSNESRGEKGIDVEAMRRKVFILKFSSCNWYTISKQELAYVAGSSAYSLFSYIPEAEDMSIQSSLRVVSKNGTKLMVLLAICMTSGFTPFFWGSWLSCICEAWVTIRLTISATVNSIFWWILQLNEM